MYTVIFEKKKIYCNLINREFNSLNHSYSPFGYSVLVYYKYLLSIGTIFSKLFQSTKIIFNRIKGRDVSIVMALLREAGKINK